MIKKATEVQVDILQTNQIPRYKKYIFSLTEEKEMRKRAMKLNSFENNAQTRDFVLCVRGLSVILKA